jgi:hypothetical protein
MRRRRTSEGASDETKYGWYGAGFYADGASVAGEPA